MTDQVHTTGEVAALLAARLIGPPDLPLTTVSGIESGGPGTLTFIRSDGYASKWANSRCSAALVSEGLAEIQGHDPTTRALLFVESADLAMVTLLQRITPPNSSPRPGNHPSAQIDPTADVHPDARVGPNVVIGPRSTIAVNTTLASGVVIGADCKIGRDSILRPNVVVEDRCEIGQRCNLHPGIVIGADGFGYIPNPDGPGVIKVPHAGNVIIHDDVEIGAATTIDRGKFGPTVIGRGTKIDNLCQIAHNCRIGEFCIICAGSCIGGSTSLGDGVTLGGHVVIADNLSLGAGCSIGGGSAVTTSTPPGEHHLGYPAYPAVATKRQWIAIRKLPDLLKSMPKPDKH